MRTVTPGDLRGRIVAPPSKSMAQRAVAIACLLKNESTIYMGTPCDDIEAALRAATALGARVIRQPGKTSITGHQQPPHSSVDCGESGLSFRMFCALAATGTHRFSIVARGSLASRPVDMVKAPLLALGAQCETNDGLPPVTVEGPLSSGSVDVDATTSSQFLSGLLIALCNSVPPAVIRAPGLTSKPYVRMTVELLRQQGAVIHTDDCFEVFEIATGVTTPLDYVVPADWSGASFPLVAGAIAGDVTVTGVDVGSPQADRRIVEALTLCGADVTVGTTSVQVRRTKDLRGFAFDASHCPDLFPPLVALAANCHGTTRIRGVHRLTTKESNRDAALRNEFGKLGLQMTVEEDTMVICGGDLKGGIVDAHNDHRMAMALAVAALRAAHRVTILGDESICKSYPDFFRDMVSLGANIV